MSLVRNRNTDSTKHVAEVTRGSQDLTFLEMLRPNPVCVWFGPPTVKEDP